MESTIEDWPKTYKKEYVADIPDLILDAPLDEEGPEMNQEEAISSSATWREGRDKNVDRLRRKYKKFSMDHIMAIFQISNFNVEKAEAILQNSERVDLVPKEMKPVFTARCRSEKGQPRITDTYYNFYSEELLKPVCDTKNLVDFYYKAKNSKHNKWHRPSKRDPILVDEKRDELIQKMNKKKIRFENFSLLRQSNAGRRRRFNNEDEEEEDIMLGVALPDQDEPVKARRQKKRKSEKPNTGEPEMKRNKSEEAENGESSIPVAGSSSAGQTNRPLQAVSESYSRHNTDEGETTENVVCSGMRKIEESEVGHIGAPVDQDIDEMPTLQEQQDDMPILSDDGEINDMPILQAEQGIDGELVLQAEPDVNNEPNQPAEPEIEGEIQELEEAEIFQEVTPNSLPDQEEKNGVMGQAEPEIDNKPILQAELKHEDEPNQPAEPKIEDEILEIEDAESLYTLTPILQDDREVDNAPILRAEPDIDGNSNPEAEEDNRDEPILQADPDVGVVIHEIEEGETVNTVTPIPQRDQEVEPILEPEIEVEMIVQAEQEIDDEFRELEEPETVHTVTPISEAGEEIDTMPIPQAEPETEDDIHEIEEVEAVPIVTPIEQEIDALPIFQADQEIDDDPTLQAELEIDYEIQEMEEPETVHNVTPIPQGDQEVDIEPILQAEPEIDDELILQAEQKIDDEFQVMEEPETVHTVTTISEAGEEMNEDDIHEIEEVEAVSIVTPSDQQEVDVMSIIRAESEIDDEPILQAEPEIDYEFQESEETETFHNVTPISEAGEEIDHTVTQVLQDDQEIDDMPTLRAEQEIDYESQDMGVTPIPQDDQETDDMPILQAEQDIHRVEQKTNDEVQKMNVLCSEMREMEIAEVRPGLSDSTSTCASTIQAVPETHCILEEDLNVQSDQFTILHNLEMRDESVDGNSDDRTVTNHEDTAPSSAGSLADVSQPNEPNTSPIDVATCSGLGFVPPPARNSRLSVTNGEEEEEEIKLVLPDHPSGVIYICCNQIFDERKIKVHRRYVHRGDHLCLLCNTKVAENQTVQQHMKLLHQKKNIQLCSCCSWVYDDRDALWDHETSMKRGGEPGNKMIARSSCEPGALMQRQI